jgi:hypothetical protein
MNAVKSPIVTSITNTNKLNPNDINANNGYIDFNMVDSHHMVNVKPQITPASSFLSKLTMTTTDIDKAVVNGEYGMMTDDDSQRQGGSNVGPTFSNPTILSNKQLLNLQHKSVNVGLFNDVALKQLQARRMSTDENTANVKQDEAGSYKDDSTATQSETKPMPLDDITKGVNLSDRSQNTIRSIPEMVAPSSIDLSSHIGEQSKLSTMGILTTSESFATADSVIDLESKAVVDDGAVSTITDISLTGWKENVVDDDVSLSPGDSNYLTLESSTAHLETTVMSEMDANTVRPSVSYDENLSTKNIDANDIDKNEVVESAMPGASYGVSVNFSMSSRESQEISAAETQYHDEHIDRIDNAANGQSSKPSYDDDYNNRADEVMTSTPQQPAAMLNLFEGMHIQSVIPISSRSNTETVMISVEKTSSENDKEGYLLFDDDEDDGEETDDDN